MGGWVARKWVEALMEMDGANHAGAVINEQASEEWEWGWRRTSLLGSLCSRAGHALVLAYSATVTRFSMAESAE